MYAANLLFHQPCKILELQISRASLEPITVVYERERKLRIVFGLGHYDVRARVNVYSHVNSAEGTMSKVLHKQDGGDQAMASGSSETEQSTMNTNHDDHEDRRRTAQIEAALHDSKRLIQGPYAADVDAAISALEQDLVKKLQQCAAEPERAQDNAWLITPITTAAAWLHVGPVEKSDTTTWAGVRVVCTSLLGRVRRRHLKSRKSLSRLCDGWSFV